MNQLCISIDPNKPDQTGSASYDPVKRPIIVEDDHLSQGAFGFDNADTENRDFVDGADAQNLPHLDFHKRKSRNQRLFTMLLILYLLLIILMFGHLG
ncbi:MAG: hypothetical protein ABJO01_07610 [Parasphingorhabdus sp.]|uniref:hypothetical protein n=1 Tax=Parasphingorhabdus sp. TaxID=2709688 RepID=UPI003297D21F